MPCGTKSPTNRDLGLAAVCASVVAAGTIASSSGSASVAPAPRRTVRLDMCFLVRNISSVLLLTGHAQLIALSRLHVHLKCLAPDDAGDDRRQAILRSCRIPHNRSHQRHILILEAAAEGIREALLGDHPNELTLITHQQVAQARDAVQFRPISQGAGRIDGLTFVLRAPCADGIKVFKRESHRLEGPVARRAGRIRMMFFEDLAHRWRLQISCGVRRLFLDRRYIWRWIGGAHAEERLQEPLAPYHW